jgi:phosphoserine aminotransferase
VSTVFLAAEQVDWMLSGSAGSTGSSRRSGPRPRSMYGWADSRAWARPFVADPDARSLVVATIDLDDDVPA